MEFVNQKVKHKVYGAGLIAAHEEGYINVSFTGCEKRFSFPAAFYDGFLRFTDESLTKALPPPPQSEQQPEPHFTELPKTECLKLLNKLKLNESYTMCIRVGLHLWKLCDKEGDEETARYILPIITSSYRRIKEPRKAISIYRDTALPRFGEGIDSRASLTSLAAAYCDISDYEYARQICNEANSKYGGSTELMNVYRRINANGA